MALLLEEEPLQITSRELPRCLASPCPDATNILLQETTLHTLLNIKEYRESSTFTAWACEIMSNIFKSNRRQASCHKRIIQQGYAMNLYIGCGTLADKEKQ